MDLTPEVRKQFQEFGRAGGLKRARRLSPASRRRIARVAAVTRWTRERFGVARFAELGLPGADLVDQGLLDSANEVESVESLLIAIAETRLRREHVPVPILSTADAELRCYRALEERHGELAHFRYNALLRQMTSFADACHLARSGPGAHAT